VMGKAAILGASVFSVMFLACVSLEEIEFVLWWFLILLDKRCRVCHKTEVSASTSTDSLCSSLPSCFPFLGFLRCPVCVRGLMGKVTRCHVLLSPSSAHNSALSISRTCQSPLPAHSGKSASWTCFLAAGRLKALVPDLLPTSSDAQACSFSSQACMGWWRTGLGLAFVQANLEA